MRKKLKILYELEVPFPGRERTTDLKVFEGPLYQCDDLSGEELIAGLKQALEVSYHTSQCLEKKLQNEKKLHSLIDSTLALVMADR